MKNQILCILLITICTLFACKEPNHPAIDLFNEMQTHQQSYNFELLKPHFDEQSLKFLEKLITARNTNELVEVGRAFGLNYFVAEYYRWNRTFDNDFEDVIKFFNLVQFSFFDLKYQFEPLRNKSKYSNDDFYLPIGYDSYTTSRIRWLRFTKDKNEDYKFDLVYSLQQEEKNQKERYKHLVDVNPDGRQTEFHILYEILPELERTEELENLTFRQLTKERENN